MGKETFTKDHPVMEALKKLKDEESELLARIKPVQEAISALEKIVEKSVKKGKVSAKDTDVLTPEVEEIEA